MDSMLHFIQNALAFFSFVFVHLHRHSLTRHSRLSELQLSQVQCDRVAACILLRRAKGQALLSTFYVIANHYVVICTRVILTLLTAEAFLLGGAVRDIRSEPRRGDLLASSLAEISGEEGRERLAETYLAGNATIRLPCLPANELALKVGSCRIYNLAKLTKLSQRLPGFGVFTGLVCATGRAM